VSNLGFDVQQMADGLKLTAEIAAGGVGASLVLGSIGGVARARGPRPVRWAISVYVEIIRGLPAILQLFILYFGLTQFSVDLSPTLAGLIWMTLYGAAYAIEIFRAGLTGVPSGQDEAAVALGLGTYTRLVKIILPQAVARMMPPLTSFVILAVKNTTLLYVIGAPELLYHANLLASSGDPLTIYLLAIAFYLVISVSIGRLGAYVESRMAWAK
jgi:His/Glu/Gln/Arg/opine family amino acid ABC transporter permease subunit